MPSQTFHISGRVIHKQSQRGITNARVEACDKVRSPDLAGYVSDQRNAPNPRKITIRIHRIRELED